MGEWSKSTFCSVNAEIKRLKRDLECLRSDPLRTAPSHIDIKTNDCLIELYLREEIMWRQRSRVAWLLEGDRNTHFFHLRASKRRRKNLIKALQKQYGQLTDDLTEMQQLALDFYKTLYTSEGVEGLDEIIQHVPSKVTIAMNDTLLAPYKEDEVKKALFQMFPTKAPGHDGFPAHFFQRHWDMCGAAVTCAVLSIVQGEESPECVNDTVLVLIPKVSKPTLLSQF